MIRRMPLAVAALVLLLLLAMTPAVAAGSRLCCVDDPRMSEVSGIAAPAADPRYVYVQNDAGDSARCFAVDTRTGRTAAVYPVPRARNDWEDLAVALALPHGALLAPTTTASHSSGPSSTPAPGNGSSDSAFGWGLIAIVAAALMAFILGSRLRRRGRHKDEGGEDLSWMG